MNKRYRQIFLIIMAIWLVFLVDSFTFIELKKWGIIPREIYGLPGIWLAPFLHGNINHILNNTFPLLGLLVILSFLYSQLFWSVLLGSIGIGGGLVWLFGSKSIHIGASGLVFSLASFLIIKSFKDNKWIFIFVSGVIVFFYSHLWVGLFPFLNKAGNISYSSHWYGFVSGIIMALLLRKKRFTLTQSDPFKNSKHNLEK